MPELAGIIINLDDLISFPNMVEPLYFLLPLTRIY